ncbi:2Fe-2S iron-sulfur cluster binding domain-containing protein [Pseudomaricurvus alkylphenolicus]|uniref:2Fe-2S iron-sulfur cluster-binding protein n=1 Tax=Pseudomaricurvus alkylphenolicus TaxID=1306991 RepID=UPI00141E9EB8|nr:2Fe-2S iron-sulfur cluster-binding protein [Pseudomaricurvus alkylphenolicus]NIB45071.1 2Fe-2S iron-sulfur cluster binding domain-containing protein [Pseudomaricurvus alkylphenolicus]
MTSIRFIESSGEEHTVEADDGRTLMDVAVDNLVPGILGECGGACVCATCHVMVEPEWQAKVPAKSDTEDAMLQGAMDVTEKSRLACQIVVDESLNGMVVHIPEHQV